MNRHSEKPDKMEFHKAFNVTHTTCIRRVFCCLTYAFIVGCGLRLIWVALSVLTIVFPTYLKFSFVYKQKPMFSRLAWFFVSTTIILSKKTL